jgi:hypothetical protein
MTTFTGRSIDYSEEAESHEAEPDAACAPGLDLQSARAAKSRQSIGDLLRDLRDEITALVQQGFMLARNEIIEELEEARNALLASLVGVVILAISGVVLALAASAGVYVALINAGLDPMVALWLSPLIIGLVGAVAGVILTSRIKKVTDADHWRPSRTERSLQETKEWVERKL